MPESASRPEMGRSPWFSRGPTCNIDCVYIIGCLVICDVVTAHAPTKPTDFRTRLGPRSWPFLFLAQTKSDSNFGCYRWRRDCASPSLYVDLVSRFHDVGEFEAGESGVHRRIVQLLAFHECAGRTLQGLHCRRSPRLSRPMPIKPRS